MIATIGIRHEDKYQLERRCPLTPQHIAKLKKDYQLQVLIEHSSKRIFTDEEFVKAGALVVSDLKKSPVIFGVKEIPLEKVEPNKTYIIFSHVIKGQRHNMPLLKKLMDLKCSLIDYEKIVDENGKRLVFFGKHAGFAGMINTLWALGLRLKHLGYETPFLKLQQSFTYTSLRQAKNVLSEIGHEIAEKGLPKEIHPIVIGFTGYGNVSIGAQEIASLLPIKEISPGELQELKKKSFTSNNLIYKVIFKEEHLYKHKSNDEEFDLQDYYLNPQNYQSEFEKHAPHLTVLVNCIYWDQKYPKILTKDFLKKLFSTKTTKLTVIGDITCDVNGSIESTVKAATIEDPLFVYNPHEEEISSGHTGKGIQMMTVDILPSELPRESSFDFGDALFKYIYPIAKANYENSFEDIKLPNPIKRALILHKGKLTPDYTYLKKHIL